METMTTKLIASGVLGVLTLVTGVVLSHSGKPLNPVLFNVHKIIAVVTIILISISIVQLYKAGETRALITLVAMVFTWISFLALVATGGMLSFEREWPAFVLKIHQVLPLISLAFSSVSAYLLVSIRV